ncbi:hypothetical protein IGI04_036559, partial [Brassica rapa subsp. trilocularis]
MEGTVPISTSDKMYQRFEEGKIYQIRHFNLLPNNHDVPKGRIRVLLNGLLPLETRLEISLPSGESKEVELEYEGLEKHYFLCTSLCHDKDDCPTSLNSSHSSIPVGINQARTLDRLAERRRADPRRDRTERLYHPSRIGALHQVPAQQQRYRHSQPTLERGNRNERRNEDRYDRRRPQHSSQSFRSESPRIKQSSHTTSQHIPLSQVSHTPSPRPLREPMRSQSAAGSGDIIASSERRPALERLAPATTQGSPKDRPSALERLSPAGSFNGSHDRRSALARLSLPSDRDPLPLYEDGGTNSGLPTCNETRYLNEPLLDVPFSKDTEVLDPLTSPIRSLSEDRRHVSLRLGPAPVKRSRRIAAAKISGKRKASSQPIPKVTIKISPPQGAPAKRRRVTK